VLVKLAACQLDFQCKSCIVSYRMVHTYI